MTLLFNLASNAASHAFKSITVVAGSRDCYVHNTIFQRVLTRKLVYSNGILSRIIKHKGTHTRAYGQVTLIYADGDFKAVPCVEARDEAGKGRMGGCDNMMAYKDAVPL